MKTKIYFAGSIRGGRNDRDTYLQIINYLNNYGEVLTEHIGDPNLLSSGEEIDEASIFKRDVDWLMSCDILVAEVTTPSLGVGYELGLAEKTGKKVLCLYRPNASHKLSAMIRGNDYFMVSDYNDLDEAISAIRSFFEVVS